MKITQRPATDEDTEFARQAHHAAYHDTVVKQFGPWDEAAQDKFFYASWQANTHHILLCDGQACGYISLDHAADHDHVREFVVHPDHQGKGIGSSVLKQIAEKAGLRNVPVKLGCFTKNSALHFYQKHGFVEYSRTETHILLQLSTYRET